MAQTGFMLSDEGRTFSATNDSGTTAIFAGDLVYTPTNNDKFTGTAAQARASYAISDVLVKSMSLSATGYQAVVGVALEDIPADGVGAISTEGIWFHAAGADTEAGAQVMGGTTVNKVVPVTVATTTVTAAVANAGRYKIGKAITGGSADGKYILWKLSI